LQTEWNRPIWTPLAIFALIAFAGVVPAAQTVHRHRNRRVRKRISEEPS